MKFRSTFIKTIVICFVLTALAFGRISLLSKNAPR